MADYLTHFSCLFDIGEAERLPQALAIRDQLAEAIERSEGFDLGFRLELAPDLGPATLWIASDGYGEPDHVVQFVLACAETFDLRGRWGFTWAFTCSKPHVDGFGGGGQVLDLSRRERLAAVDCADWVARMLAAGPDPAETVHRPVSRLVQARGTRPT